MKSVSFICHELKMSVSAKLTGPIVVVQHDPEGWQQIQRKWKLSFTEWQGAPSYELQIPFVIDKMLFNYATGRSMQSAETDIRKMERLAEKLPTKPRTPIFKIDSHGVVPHDLTNDPTKQWVMSTLTWGDYIINSGNSRTRQDGTAAIWEFVPDTILKAKERLPARAVPKKYMIKKGDTLQKIAAYFYGDQAQWHTIAKLNKIRDPIHLKKGKWIKLPTVKVN